MNSSATPFTIDVVSEVVQENQRQQPISPVPIGYSENESLQSVAFSRISHRKARIVTGAAMVVVAGVSLAQVDRPAAKYEGKLQLVVAPDAKETNQTPPAATQSTPSIDYATQIRILWSPKVLAPVVEQLQKQYPDLNYERLSQNLDITHQSGSNTLEIRYQDSDPQKTQTVLERVSQAYIQYSQECRSSLCQKLQFVESQIPHLQKQADRVQKQLNSFQQKHGFTNSEQQGKQLSERRHRLLQQQQDVQIQLAEAEALHTLLQSQIASNAEPLENPFLKQNSRYQALLKQFQATSSQISIELGRSKPNTSTLQSLQQQYQQQANQLAQAAQQPLIDRLAQATATEAINHQEIDQLRTLMEWVQAAHQIQMLDTSRQAIGQAEASLNQQIQQWAVLARQHHKLQLDVQLATNNLNLYLTRQAEMRQFTKPSQPWRVTAPPQVESTAENGLLLPDAQWEFSLSLVLCFVLVLGAIALWRDPKSVNPTPGLSESDVLPDSVWQPFSVTPLPASQPTPIWSNQLQNVRVGVAVLLLKTAIYAEATRDAKSSLYLGSVA
jgi:uncharacterized protein involved in exopolysaccharide biosynthesis